MPLEIKSTKVTRRYDDLSKDTVWLSTVSTHPNKYNI